MSEVQFEVNSQDEAKTILMILEKLNPELKWVMRHCKPTEYVPPYNTFYILVDTDAMEVDYTFKSIFEHFSFDKKVQTNRNLKTSQNAKADDGKPKLDLVPRQILYDIARVREYGNEKYGDPENWRTVEPERYRNAAFRHLLQYLDDPYGNDKESGLPHLWHLACNVAFLCEMEKGEFDG